MGLSSDSAKAIANLGVDMIITAETKYATENVIEIVQIVRSKGRHITVHAGSRSSESMKEIAKVGGTHVTISI